MSIMSHSSPVLPNYITLIICNYTGKNEVSLCLKQRLNASKQMELKTWDMVRMGMCECEGVRRLRLCGLFLGFLHFLRLDKVKCVTFPSWRISNCLADTAAPVVVDR